MPPQIRPMALACFLLLSACSEPPPPTERAGSAERTTVQTGHQAQTATPAHLDAASKLAAKLGLSFERKRIALQLADLFEELHDYKRAVQQHKLAWRLQNETRVS